MAKPIAEPTTPAIELVVSGNACNINILNTTPKSIEISATIHNSPYIIGNKIKRQNCNNIVVILLELLNLNTIYYERKMIDFF